MLRLMGVVDQFHEIVRGIVEEWSELRLELTVDDEERVERAAALMGPANPGRLGRKIRFVTDRAGPGIRPEAMRRLLKRLEDEGIGGELALVGVQKATPGEILKKETLRSQWDGQMAVLPADWSDLYAEVRLDSTDYLERAALLMAPLNPARFGTAANLRFRSAQRFGYGASPGMAARCLERCDDEGITGQLAVLHALSDTEPVATQGPVWIQGGRVV
jgi:hypothetical protein